MIAAFFRPPAKRVCADIESRPASPQSRTRDSWALVDASGSRTMDASLSSLSELDDVFDETASQASAQTSTPSPPSTVRSTPGMPVYWTIGSPSDREIQSSSRDLVMPGSLDGSFVPRAIECSGTPPKDLDVPAVSSRLSLRAVALPVGSAIVASCATVAYHALGTVVAASYDMVPMAVMPGFGFLASHYPMASLIGTAAGSLWGLHHLCRPGPQAGNVGASRVSMCVSALTTSVWLFVMGPAALVGTAGSMAFDLAQPAAQTYLLGALGLIYNYDWLHLETGANEGGEPGPRLIMHPEDAAELLALSERLDAENSEK